MARTTSNSYHGSIGDFSFYERNGQGLVRTKGGGSGKKISTSPSCAAVVQSNVEFGAASHIGALLRRAIGPKLRFFSDMNMIGNLVGVLRIIIGLGSGAPGQRVLDIGAHAALLEGFEFNKDCSFESRFKKEITITFAEDHNTAVLHTSFCPATDIAAPEGATSFELVYTFMRVPAYGSNATTRCYEPLNGEQLVSAQVSSAYLYTTLALPVKLTLPVKLPASTSAEGTALLCVVGIAFYKGKVRMAKDVCGMRVVKVG